ncbi:RNA recognition motif domain [Dillenia turbinata]|uniref:RNA recognition motif domain n=1 Tax=Dillenia turbinata TaxID=194707 RepID=A0AAN8WJ16_9MAGN
MDLSDSTRIVFDRIQKLEPENVAKIVGYLLLQEHGEREMIRLAFGPDRLIHSSIYKAKIELGLISQPPISAPVSPSILQSPGPLADYTPLNPFSQASSRRVPTSHWDHEPVSEQPPIHNSDFAPLVYDAIYDEYKLQQCLEEQLEASNQGVSMDYYAALGNLTSRNHRRSLEFPVKVCHYFSKGFCKHGSSCRYSHGQSFPDNYSQMVCPTLSDFANDDHVFSPGSLEKLELEITELLKSRRGSPVSIASLPMMYYEKYGRILQADGYLTESQRHGKAGYSLTKLLARLKNSIQLIERPHGQHCVILAEDAPKLMDNRGERSDPGQIVSGSRQIYLTFPAESTFTEVDVSNYFNTFGPVQDVRIPCQQKRMFGFVTFENSETVRTILSKGNPHFVCGARVLVKPYREKSKLIDRKYPDKFEPPMFCPRHLVGMDYELGSTPRGYETTQMPRKQFMEDYGRALELESMRLSELRLSQKPLNGPRYFGNTVALEELNINEEFNYLLDVLNNSNSASADKPRQISTNYQDQDSTGGLNLPENPFASPIASGISTFT